MTKAPVDNRGQIIKGSGANAVMLGARILEQLLLVPILLSAWSVDLYGEWMLLATIPVYLSLSDMGFITAGSNELARRVSVGDDSQVKGFFADYSRLFFRWSLVLLVIFAIGSFMAPIDQWLNLKQMSREQAQMAFVLLVGSAIASQNSLTMLAGLRARRMFPMGLLFKGVITLLQLVCNFLVVTLLDGGPVAVAAVMVSMRCLEVVAQVILLHRQDLAPSFSLFRRSSERLGRYLAIGVEYMLMPMAQAIVLQGMTLMIGVSLGAAAVAIFTTHRTLTRLTSQVLQLAVAPLRNEVGLLQGAQDKPLLYQLLKTISALTFWVSLILALLLFLAGPFLFRLWTGGKIEFVHGLFAVLILSTILEGIWRVASSIRLGSNRHRPLVWGYFGLSLLGILAAYLLGQAFGLSTVAFALVFVDGAMCILTIYATVTLFDVSVGGYLKGLATPPVSELRALGRRIRRKVMK